MFYQTSDLPVKLLEFQLQRCNKLRAFSKYNVVIIMSVLGELMDVRQVYR